MARLPHPAERSITANKKIAIVVFIFTLVLTDYCYECVNLFKYSLGGNLYIK